MELSFAIILLISLLSQATSSRYSLPAIKPWCDQTLYPELCEYFFIHNPKYSNSPIQNKSNFLKMSVKLVLDRALNASEMAKTLGSKCRDNRERAAWLDCVDLYKKSTIELKQTLAADPNNNWTPSNIQSCLSNTLTNINTCEQGFIDFGTTDNVMPLIIDHVLKKLTINALSTLNSGSFGGTRYQYGFPTWVSPSERKLLQSSTLSSWADVVVARDGSGDYTNIKDAIDAVSKRSGSQRFVIYMKAGIYEEYIKIESENITMVGEGIGKTIITGNRKNQQNVTSLMSGTVIVDANGFIARGITFRNTAGPGGGQAVAFRSDSKFSAYYKCSFEGYQDTLYVRSNERFYRECDVYGTVDFIFGDATVVFQKCNIFVRNPPNKVNTITAQSRSHFLQRTGMSFHKCNVTAAPDLVPVQKSVKTYLGRPWRKYSRVVFMKTYLDTLIDPQGWLAWNAPLDTLYYGEYENLGPGSSTIHRVKWPGYHVITRNSEASGFSVRQFINGSSWLPGTRTPFNYDL